MHLRSARSVTKVVRLFDGVESVAVHDVRIKRRRYEVCAYLYVIHHGSLPLVTYVAFLPVGSLQHAVGRVCQATVSDGRESRTPAPRTSRYADAIRHRVSEDVDDFMRAQDEWTLTSSGGIRAVNRYRRSDQPFRRGLFIENSWARKKCRCLIRYGRKPL